MASGHAMSKLDCLTAAMLSYTRARLQKHSPGIFDVLLDLDKELHGLPTIEKAVVVRQGQVHHGSNLDLAVDGNRTFLDGMEAKNSRLRQVDDGSAHERAEDTAVADGERTASHVFNRKLAIAGLLMD